MTPELNKPTPNEKGEISLATMLQSALAVADQPRAETVTNPHSMAAKTIGKLTGTVSAAVGTRLEEEAKAINSGDLRGIEARLATQAVTMHVLSNHLLQTAIRQSLAIDDFASYVKLALRAQAQSTAALTALAEIKQGPRVIVAKQLNAAHQQVVNNHLPSSNRAKRRNKHLMDVPASKALPEPSPLNQYAPMDTRSPREAAPEHSALEPVEEIHRPANGMRKTEELP